MQHISILDETQTIMITGGCGFIGQHFVEHVIKNTKWKIVIIDKLSYASMGFKRINEQLFEDAILKKRLKIYTWDLSEKLSVGMMYELNNINIIVHMAAETHVDNSITNPELFVKNNILSTLYILEYARSLKKLNCFFYFSTDEVYGPALGDKLFKEDERHNPTNPYSASKSGAEQLCIAYHNTYKIPIIRINVMNAFGEKQHVEKFIPSTIKKLVWNTNVGESIGKTKCTCCKSTDITQMSFNCGHIIAEANGGKTNVSNLKPICQNCNSSMGTKNMNEFMLSLK